MLLKATSCAHLNLCALSVCICACVLDKTPVCVYVCVATVKAAIACDDGEDPILT